MRVPAILLLSLIAVGLTACAPPPRVTLYEERHGTDNSAPENTYSVQRGDNVYRIAQRFDVSTRALIDENRLKPPYDLYIGQKLKLPVPRVHVVARGDTVYGISRRYGVDMSQLVQVNGLRPPYTILVGQKLRMPGSVETQVATKPTPPAPRPSGRTSRVERRELPPLPRQSQPSPPSERLEPRAERPAAPRPTVRRLAPVPKASPAGYVWPVEGRLISRFGGKGKGLHNDGINLAAARGTPVIAAQNGVVAYAGNELRGFGNLVLIKHSGDVMTAYAHNEALLVRAGDNVTRGQQIARVGSTGSVDTPQLHFEIRFGRQAVDPFRFLGKRRAGLDDGVRRAAGRAGRPDPG